MATKPRTMAAVAPHTNSPSTVHPRRGRTPLGSSKKSRSGAAKTRATSLGLGVTSTPGASQPTHGEMVKPVMVKTSSSAPRTSTRSRSMPELLVRLAERRLEERIVARLVLSPGEGDLTGMTAHRLGTAREPHVHLSVALEERDENRRRGGRAFRELADLPLRKRVAERLAQRRLGEPRGHPQSCSTLTG